MKSDCFIAKSFYSSTLIPAFPHGRQTIFTGTSHNAILNDLKILFNFEMDSRDRTAVLLAGLPKPNSTLRLAIHELLYQRLVMNYNLEGMSKEEGRSYIHEKLKGAGCNQTLFHEAAVEATAANLKSLPQT